MFVLLLLLTVSVTRSEYVDVINVGTTLFSDADNAMKCWSKESIALLASRKIFQDALPSEKFSVVPNDDYVEQFIKYFQILVQDVKKISYGKSQHILMLALADVLGGYLNHYLLPTAKYAHYFGYLTYDSVKRLYNVYYELCAFLNTDGIGWMSPRNMTDSLNMFSPQQLPVIDIENENETCQQLVFSTKNTGRKTASRDAATVVIPMPFFDSKTTPSSIAVPFRTHSLRNMQSRSASNILLKYYILSTKCLHSQKNAAINTQIFNRKLYSWISSEVLGLLDDDEWYSAFGGIFRLLETLRQKGSANSDQHVGEYNVMPPSKTYSKVSTDFDNSFEQMMLSNNRMYDKHHMMIIFWIILAIILIWVIIGIIFLLYRRYSHPRNYTELGTDDKHGAKKATSKSNLISSCVKPSTTDCNERTCPNASRTSVATQFNVCKKIPKCPDPARLKKLSCTGIGSKVCKDRFGTAATYHVQVPQAHNVSGSSEKSALDAMASGMMDMKTGLPRYDFAYNVNSSSTSTESSPRDGAISEGESELARNMSR